MPKRLYESERKLWGAVINQAILDYNLVPKTTRKMTREHQLAIKKNATNWFRSNANYIGSLNWICENYDLTPDDIRKLAGVQ